MDKEIERHQETQTIVNVLKELLDNAVADKRTTQQVKILMSNFCYKCLQPKDTECEICGGWGSFRNIPHRE